MSLYSDAQNEVLWQIRGLLPTIDEALHHMLVQLDELRLEESSILFQDVAEAISSIANSLLPLLATQTAQNILYHTTHLRQAISQVTDAYEVATLFAVQSALNDKLIPAFACWQLEIRTSNLMKHQLS